MLITLVALVLRVIFLAQDSFWGDEILSVQRANMDWLELRDFISGLPAMTAYYLILHLWVLWGDNEFVVRLLSVVLAVATLPVIYLLGKRLFDEKVGLIAALLLAVNAFHIQYSQEARAYSLVVLLISLSSLYFVRSIDRPSWGNILVYAVTSTIAVYAHLFAILVLFAQALSLILLVRQPVPWTKLLLGGLAILAGLVPMVMVIVTTSEGVGEMAPRWIPVLSLDQVHDLALKLTGMGGTPLLIIYLVSLLAGILVALEARGSRLASIVRWKYGLVIGWLFIPVIITVAYSAFIEPSLVPRYLIVSLPALILLAAAGIHQVYRILPARVPLFSTALVVLVIAFSTRGVYGYYSEFEKEDWRGVANFLASEARPGDAIIFYQPQVDKHFDFYYDRSPNNPPQLKSLVRAARHSDPMYSGDPSTVSQLLPAQNERVWLIISRVGANSTLHEPVVNGLLTALRSRYPFEENRHYPRVSVTLFAPEGISSLSGEINVRCQTLVATIVGTPGDDVLTGTEGPDVIHGLAGNDTIYGLGGDDIICGGTGSDILDGGEGNDILVGGQGDDILMGRPGDDLLNGGSGIDQLQGDFGTDLLNGGADDDHLDGEEGDDTLYSGEGADLLEGGEGVDLCRGRGANRVDGCESH